MANSDAAQSKIPWHSWLILAFHLVWSAGVLLFTFGEAVTPWVRWGVTGTWVLLTLAFGLYDFVMHRGGGDTDATAFDRWTIVHALAGVVFGVWYIPLVFLLITVVFWECFEFSVVGFGDQEVILNRVVDIAVAVLGWLMVVIVVIAVSGAPFPWAAPYPG